MGDLNPLGRGVPSHIQRMISSIYTKIEEDHVIQDTVDGPNPHLVCSCGTKYPDFERVLHLNNEAARIIDLEQSL